VVQHHRLLA